MLENAFHVADVLFEDEVKKILVIQYTVVNNTALQIQ
jgi:hypothetical protein